MSVLAYYSPDQGQPVAVEPLLKVRVCEAYNSGVSAEPIKRRFHLTDGEFEDMTGEPVEETEDTGGRSATTGY